MIKPECRKSALQRLLAKNDRPLFSAFVCDDCARFQSATAKYPPESGARSCLCASCQHFNIGSTTVVFYYNHGHPETMDVDDDNGLAAEINAAIDAARSAKTLPEPAP